MTTRRTLRAGRAIAAAAALALAVACGGGAKTPSQGSPSVAARPSSTAALKILKPANGGTVTGSTVRVEMSLDGAKITSVTSQNLKPDEGHLHLKLDDVIVSMTGGLITDVPDVKPGSHFLEAEFVASDHSPFNPRVFTGVTFIVK